MSERDELLRQHISELEKEVDAATTARHAAEVASALAASASALTAWVVAERSLELLPEGSTERDAEDTAAEYLAAALAEDYLAAERALRVSTQVATQPDVTSAEEVEATKSPALRQQQQQCEPVAVWAVAASNGPGEVRAVATSSGTGSIRRVVLQQKRGLGQRGASTRPFDPGTPKYSMPSLRPENEPSTVWGGYDEEHQEEQGDYSSSGSSSNSSSTSSSKRLDKRWDGTSSFPFDRGKI